MSLLLPTPYFNKQKFSDLQCNCRTSDGTEQILFGDLFKLNEKISNKCVGLLQRARKYR